MADIQDEVLQFMLFVDVVPISKTKKPVKEKLEHQRNTFESNGLRFSRLKTE